jgi:(hydroxyamino)benzene mutase
MLSRQGHRLLQIGVVFFAYFVRRICNSIFCCAASGLSAHSLMALLGVLLIAMGLVRPRLHLEIGASRFAF